MTGLLRIPYQLFRPLYEMTPLHRAVIDELPNEQMQQAYDQCRVITRKHARTFYMATRFLPNEKQRGIFAIYALCRYMDDLVDEAEDLLKKKQIQLGDVREEMDRFREKLLLYYTGKEREDPVLFAFTDVLRRWQIPINLPLELMEGVLMDLERTRYKTFDQLYEYSYKVASTVGLMTSNVFGYRDDQALQHAVDLGIAMQLTNILRDIGEDLRKDRIYLPLDEMELFGITEQQLFDGEIDQSFIQFMRFQFARARRYYESADRGITYLSADSRLPVCLARENYSSILTKIEENDYRVFDRRAYLNTREKFSILPKVYLRMKRTAFRI